MRLKRAIGILLFLLLFAGYIVRNPTQSTLPQQTVVVSRVLDGDTVELTDGRHVRYEGINAPELHDKFGEEARALNEQLLQSKSLQLEISDEKVDIYGRTLGFFWLADGTMVNETMVEDGYAKPVPYFGKKSKYYDRLLVAQEDAKTAHRGMWAK